MIISEQGKALIRQHEGLRLKAYRCAAGVWTIGYGHTKNVYQGQLISWATAKRLLDEDLKNVERTIARYVLVPLQQHEIDALASFIFNIGEGAFARSTLLKRLNRGEKESIPRELMRWTNAAGRPLMGLVARRHAEAVHWTGKPEAQPRRKNDKNQVESKPQEPAGKPLKQSTTAWSAGVAGTASALSAAREAIRPLEETAHAGSSLGTSITQLAASPWVFVSVIALCACLWIIRERARHAREEGV